MPGVVLGVRADTIAGWLKINGENQLQIVPNVISLVAKGLSGGDAGQSHPGTGVLPRRP